MENKNIKIAVAGTGYVGLSIATLLSQHHQVTAVDVVPEKVELINIAPLTHSGRIHREVSGRKGTPTQGHNQWRRSL